MTKKILLTLGLGLIVMVAFAQQQATYTQYMFNGMSINPAYIGTQDGFSVAALARWQWMGVEGAPTTQTLAMHTSVPGKNIGLGAQFIHDRIAVLSTTSFLLGYSYKVEIGQGALHMGMQGGVQNFKDDLASVYTVNPDPAFSETVSSYKPNFGVGLFYYNPVFYLGASAPYVINNKVEYEGENVYTQSRHYFVSGGAVFPLSPTLKMKPNFLLKMVEGAPISVDYNVNFLLHEILWLGVSYRPPESINFIVELNINQQFRLGYAYDHVIDQTLSEMTASSHEIMLSYIFKWYTSNVVTPRYF